MLCTPCDSANESKLLQPSIQQEEQEETKCKPSATLK